MKAAPLAIPEDVLKQHAIIFGKTGAGKSSVLRHIVEHLLSKGKRVCIIDPKGDWWGLPSAADGKAPGFPVVLFGDFKNRRSDVPMDSRAGKDVAQIIASSDQACVLGFRGWMPGDLTRFFLDFAPTLFNHNAGELYLVVDEVHNFAPKAKIMSPDGAKMLHWMNRLASEGRGLGLKLLLASQRPQKVHNDTASCCETLIAMRVVHPRDRAAIKDWISENASDSQGARLLAEIPRMSVGEGWVWFPDGDFLKCVQFPMFRTFDSFSEHATAEPIAWAKVDVEAVRQQLHRVVREKEQNDPQLFKTRIGELERRNQTLEKAVETLQQQPECEAFTADEFEQLCDIRRLLEKLNISLPWLEQVTTIKLKTLAGKTRITPLPKPPPAVPPMRVRPERGAGIEQNGTLPEMPRRILTALAQHPGGLTKTQILVHADYRSSGPVSKCFAQLARDGWIVNGVQAGTVAITGDGLKALGNFDPLPTGADLREHLLNGSKLSTMEKALLRVTFDCYPNPISKGEILEQASYKSSGPVSKAFAKLARISYLVPAGRSMVKAADMFFQ